MMIFVPAAAISDNPFQKRQHYGEIAELAADIRRHKATRPDTLGLQQVPTARIVFRSAAETRILTAADLAPLISDNGRFAPPKSTHIELEFGHRRLRALRLLGETDIDYAWVPLNILPLTDEEMLNGVWSENEARKNLSDVERAELIRTKLDTGLTQQQVADEWGLSRSQVSWLLGLLGLPEEIKAANRIGELPGRTAYALRDVANIASAVSNKRWGKLGRGSYGPVHPAEYIESVLTEPEKHTSDSVRQYVRNASAWAGVLLPEMVAKFSCSAVVPTPDVVQVTCHGCRYRINDACVKSDCAITKKKLVAKTVLEAVAAETGLRISGNTEKDFAPSIATWDTRRDIKAAYDAGIDANWVLAFFDEGQNVVRPFVDGQVWTEKQIWENDGRGGIAIAPRGGYLSEDADRALAALKAAEKGEDTKTAVADIAGPALRESWQEEAENLVRIVHERLVENMAESLYLPTGDAADIIQAAMCSPDSDWVDDHERFCEMFVKFLLRQGSGVRSHYRPLENYDSLDAMSRRAGLGSLTLNPPDMAIMLMGHWYSIRSYPYMAEDWPDVTDRMEKLLASWYPMGSGEELDSLRYELGRALADARNKMSERAAQQAASATTCLRCEAAIPADKTYCWECERIMEPAHV